jgi:hypothetical protein
MKRISSSTQGRVGAGKHSIAPRSYASTWLRIPAACLLLACTPGITQAWYGGSCGVRYSPYALSYRNSGLVPGDVQYTPYALSYRNSGLVEGYGVCPEYGYAFPVVGPGIRSGIFPPIVHRPAAVVRRHVQAPPRPRRAPDGIDIIRRHLHAKGFDSPCINRILRVDDQLVSVDFLVPDRNLLIKYWNPQALGQLDTKADYKQKAYAKYQQDWDRYAQQYKQKGGEIYTVSASEPETIVAALDSCTRLSPGLEAPTHQTMYAKK